MTDTDKDIFDHFAEQALSPDAAPMPEDLQEAAGKMHDADIDLPPSAALDEPAPPTMDMVDADIVDRSMWERYTKCAGLAVALEAGAIKDESLPAASGTAVHTFVAEGVAEYVASGISPIEYWRQELGRFRPDVAEDAIRGIRVSLWSIAAYLTDNNPADVLAFDSGTGKHDPQMGVELIPGSENRRPIWATTHVDLLLSGLAATERVVIDWKTGNAVHSTVDVRDAFQFQLQAYLVMKTWQDVDTVRVAVWNTRKNILTPFVTFTADMLRDMEVRLIETARVRDVAIKAVAETLWTSWDGTFGGKIQNVGTALIEALPDVAALARSWGDPIFWPSPGKCEGCPLAAYCPDATIDAGDLAADPVRYVEQTVALQAALAKRLDTLRKAVDEQGADFHLPDGRSFGLDAPKQVRRPSASQYRVYRIKDLTPEDDPPAAKPKKKGKKGKATPKPPPAAKPTPSLPKPPPSPKGS